MYSSKKSSNKLPQVDTHRHRSYVHVNKWATVENGQGSECKRTIGKWQMANGKAICGWRHKIVAMALMWLSRHRAQTQWAYANFCSSNTNNAHTKSKLHRAPSAVKWQQCSWGMQVRWLHCPYARSNKWQLLFGVGANAPRHPSESFILPQWPGVFPLFSTPLHRPSTKLACCMPHLADLIQFVLLQSTSIALLYLRSLSLLLMFRTTPIPNTKFFHPQLLTYFPVTVQFVVGILVSFCSWQSSCLRWNEWEKDVCKLTATNLLYLR